MTHTQTIEVVGIKSRTEKTYTISIAGAEPRDWPHSRQRIYRPARLTVVKRDGNVASIQLTGPMVKKDGSDGGQWATERFYSGATKPAWLDSIIGGLA